MWNLIFAPGSYILTSFLKMMYVNACELERGARRQGFSSSPCDGTLPVWRRSICRGDRPPAVVHADQTDIDVLTDTGSPCKKARRTTH